MNTINLTLKLVHTREAFYNGESNHLSCNNNWKTLKYVIEVDSKHIHETSKAHYNTIGELLPKMIGQIGLDGTGYDTETNVEIKIKMLDYWIEHTDFKNEVHFSNCFPGYKIEVFYCDQLEEIHTFVPSLNKIKSKTIENNKE